MAEGDSNYTGQQSGEQLSEAHQWLQNFWPKQMEQIKSMTPNDFKSQELPLARIKKIMKLDEDVKMISQEAPLLFSKAAEIFISELSLRAWAHTEDNKRRTLQRNDIAMAISKFDQFDFLIDIVPRDVDPAKPARRDGQQSVTDASNTAGAFYVQMAAPQTGATSAQPQTIQLGQPAAQVSATPQVIQLATPQQGQQQTIQLSAEQLQAIQQQMARGPGEPIIIQASTPTSQTQGFTAATQNQQIQFVQQQQPTTFIQQSQDQSQQPV